jgi:glycerophosphoryl diester phosphodiesterase
LDRVDAGHWFTPEPGVPAPTYPFRGRRISVPRFRVALQRYPDARLIVELKTPDAELARRTIDEIRAANAVERVVLGSFYGQALRAARKYEPRISTGAAREETRWALYRSRLHWPLGRTRYREFQVPERSGNTIIVTPQFIAHAHRAGLPVRIWTVDDMDDMRRLLAWGADSIISDRPDVAVQAVREWAERPTDAA